MRFRTLRKAITLRSIGGKLVLALGLTFLLFLGINEFTQRSVIAPRIINRDRVNAIRGATRVLATINHDIHTLANLCQVWARLDQGRPLEFPQDDREPVFALRVAPGKPVEVVIEPTWQLPLDEIAQQLDQHRLREQLQGLIRLSNGRKLLLAAAMGQSDTKVVVGRVFDDTYIESVRHRTSIHFSFRNGIEMTQNALLVKEAGDEFLVVQARLPGLAANDEMKMVLKVPRHDSIRSANIFALGRQSFVVCGVTALLVLLLLLQRIVIDPLTKLRAHLDQFGHANQPPEKLDLGSNDEIAQVAHTFDGMMERLRSAQTALVDASSESGRSQVAATVIHNVGNVLTNVNSLVDTTRDRIKELRPAPLHRLAERLEKDSDNNDLMLATPRYLHSFADQLEKEQSELAELLVTLNDNVHHIHKIIRNQQQHASTQTMIQSVRLIEMIEEAIGCCQARLVADRIQVDVHGNHSVSKELTVEVDRSLTLQTMVNLITNARQAMLDQPAPERRLDINLISDGEKVQIKFVDNGKGMSPETLVKVFDAHFTTRAEGTGLGLHFCALALKRCGGSIVAHSDGEGQGAVMTVLLPISKTSSLAKPIVESLSKPAEMALFV